jgi:TonB-linked SusC/RagA family outer membrane protein
MKKAHCTPRHFRRGVSSKMLVIMKLTAALLFSVCLQVSASGYSQNVSLSGKNAPIEKIIREIKKQTGYSFFFDESLLQLDSRVSIDVREVPLKAALDICFRNLPLTYSIVGTTVVVRPKEGKPDGSAAEAAAPMEVHGIITDDKGQPLEGVSVTVKGTTLGTASGHDGRFSILADAGETLQFSMVGYKTWSVKLTSQTTSLKISMVLESSSLTDLVLVGYGSQKKINLTGAVSTVSGDILDDKPIPNVGRGLMGQLPGLTIASYDGQPGRGAVFTVRGFGSINGGGPYILVDGIPADINNINPDDIASVTVLKDAASAAVYGSRAAFGVILVTTKLGSRKGSPKVSYNNNYAIHKITNLPDVVTDPATVVNFKNEAYSAYYGTNLYNSYFVNYAGQRSKDPSLPAAIPDPNNPTTNYLYAGATNWFNELYKPDNLSLNHNMSISGGGDKISYFISGGYNQQTGVYRYNPDVYDRYNLRAKLDYVANKWLTLTYNSAYNRTAYNYPTLWTSDWTSGDLYHQIGRANSLAVLKNPDGSWTSSGVEIGFLPQGGRGKTVTNEIQNTLAFATSFFHNTWRIRGDYTFRSDNSFDHSYQLAVPYENGPDQTVYNAGHSNASSYSTDIGFTNINLYTEYENNFRKNYFKVLLGYNQEVNNYDSTYAENDQLISSNVGYLNQTTGLHPQVSAGANAWALRGAFYRVNYSYNNRYLLELDGRYDGSSRFPENNHYGFFPSASAGWKISEESFFSGIKKTVNNLKVRASYGKLGNDQSLGNYSFIPTLGEQQVSNILGGVQPTAVTGPNLVSSNLTWESVYSRNLGIDLTVANRLDASFDIFRRDTKNMITYGPTLPAVLGQSQPLENAADLKTYGWEFTASYRDQFILAGKPLRFNVWVKAWDDQTIITRYNNPTKFWFSGKYYTGMHVGDFWGLQTVGIFQSDNEGKSWADQSKLVGYYPQNVAGELKYADLNHDGKIDYGNGTVSSPGDAKVIGNTHARYNFGLGTSLTWNNIDFGITFQGVGKASFNPGTTGYYWSMFFAPWENVYKNMIGSTWTPQNPNAFFPSLKGWRAGDAGNWLDLAVPQSRYTFSAAYIRLKNLSVGYSLSPRILKKLGVDRIRLYVSGQDLWEHDKLPQGFDPEGLNGAWGAGKIYPFQRAYSCGLDLRF